MDAFRTVYVAPPFKATDPGISPALLPDADLLRTLQTKNNGGKKVCFVSGENDNITEQVETMVKRLTKLEIDVVYRECDLLFFLCLCTDSDRMTRVFFMIVEEIKDAGHAWDKSHPAGNWEAKRKDEAYSFIADFLRGVYWP